MFGWCFLLRIGLFRVRWLLDCAVVWFGCVWLVKVLFCGVLGVVWRTLCQVGFLCLLIGCLMLWLFVSLVVFDLPTRCLGCRLAGLVLDGWFVV